MVYAIVAVDDFGACLNNPERIVGVQRHVLEHRATCEMPLPARFTVPVALILRHALRLQLRG